MSSLLLDAPAGSPAPDQVCAAAVDLARQAVITTTGQVGEHLGVYAEGERVVGHVFECTAKGYRGWRWVVTVARASRARVATVDEVALLPGPDAMLAPAWVPWSERVRAGDLGVGDLMETATDDWRLVPAHASGEDGDGELDVLAAELGLGRARVMSREGRADAVIRWTAGDGGPGAKIAKKAPAACGSCGFLLQLAGVLHGVVGVCGNEMAPDDGRIVTVDHGCGAHSEAVVVISPPDIATEVLDDDSYEHVDADEQLEADEQLDADEQLGADEQADDVQQGEPVEADEISSEHHPAQA